MNNRKISLPIADAEKYVSILVKSGTPHKIYYTNNSQEIQIEDRHLIFTEKELSPYELNFIGRAKKDVVFNSERLDLPDRNPVFYHIYNQKNMPENLIEIDINSAYWETAFQCGLICRGIYDAGNSVSKQTRLIAFGAAAAVKQVFEFDGKEYTSCTEQKNEYGRRAFFYVASQVASSLREVCDLTPGESVLYWVDAIVIRPGWSSMACRMLFDFGYQIKQKTLSGCQYEETAEYRQVSAIDPTGKQKTFRKWKGGRNGENALYRLINRNLKK